MKFRVIENRGCFRVQQKIWRWTPWKTMCDLQGRPIERSSLDECKAALDSLLQQLDGTWKVVYEVEEKK